MAWTWMQADTGPEGEVIPERWVDFSINPGGTPGLPGYTTTNPYTSLQQIQNLSAEGSYSSKYWGMLSPEIQQAILADPESYFALSGANQTGTDAEGNITYDATWGGQVPEGFVRTQLPTEDYSYGIQYVDNIDQIQQSALSQAQYIPGVGLVVPQYSGSTTVEQGDPIGDAVLAALISGVGGLALSGAGTLAGADSAWGVLSPAAASADPAIAAGAMGGEVTGGLTLADTLGVTSAASAGTGLSFPSIPQPVKDAASVAGAAGSIAGLSDADYGLSPLDTGIGPTATGIGPAGVDDPGLSGMDPGFIKSLADALGTTPENLGKILGAFGPAALGAFGAYTQGQTQKDLANQFASYGAPYRQRLGDLYNNPGAYLSSPEVQIPVQQGTDALARSLSAKVGNPIGNMTALGELQNYSANQLYGRLGQEKDRLAGFGGLSYYNQAAPGAMGAASGATGDIFNALGSGLANYMNPPSTLESLLKSLQGSGIFKVA